MLKGLAKAIGENKKLLIPMLRVMVECKNVRSERIAKYLARLTDGFRNTSLTFLISLKLQLPCFLTSTSFAFKFLRIA